MSGFKIPSPFAVLGGIALYVFIVATGFVIIGPALFLQAWVATILWGWFVSPAFHVPALTLALAVGIRLTFKALMGNESPMTNKNDGNSTAERFHYSLGLSYIGPFIALLFGYFVHILM